MSKIDPGQQRIFLTLDVDTDDVSKVLNWEPSVHRFMRAAVDAVADDFGPQQLKLMPVHQLVEMLHADLADKRANAERLASEMSGLAYQAAEHNSDYLSAMTYKADEKRLTAEAEAYSYACAAVRTLSRHLGYSGDFPEGEATAGL